MIRQGQYSSTPSILKWKSTKAATKITPGAGIVIWRPENATSRTIPSDIPLKYSAMSALPTQSFSQDPKKSASSPYISIIREVSPDIAAATQSPRIRSTTSLLSSKAALPDHSDCQSSVLPSLGYTHGDICKYKVSIYNTQIKIINIHKIIFGGQGRRRREWWTWEVLRMNDVRVMSTATKYMIEAP